MKKVLIKAAEAAGSLIKENMGRDFFVSSKSNRNDLVTEVDKACEQKVIQIIKEHFPDHGIIGEEFGKSNFESDYQWIIDPIDGTVNFAHSIPLCAVSIGLAYKKQVIMGVVYNPMMDEMFHAYKGEGAYLNNKSLNNKSLSNPALNNQDLSHQKIQVSTKDDFSTAVLVTGIVNYIGDGRKSVGVIDKLMNGGRPVRSIGSAALSLAWVACGRFEGYFEYGLNPWDVAAGKIILEEAGGKFTDFKGQQEPVLGPETLATNGLIHTQLQELIIS